MFRFAESICTLLNVIICNLLEKHYKKFFRMTYRIISVLACVMFCNKLVVIFQTTYILFYSWGRFLVGLLFYVIQNCNICFRALASWPLPQIVTVFKHFYLSLVGSTNRWDFLYFKIPYLTKKSVKFKILLSTSPRKV